MADHRCPACGSGVPRGAGFCPACGTAVNAPALPFEATLAGSAVTEQEIALGAARPNPKRGALVVAVVAVLVVGGGLIVGAGSGDDGQQGSSSTPSTTAAPPSTLAERRTRRTADRSTTTSTLPTYTADLIPQLGGVPLYAVVNDRVLRIDTATGQAVALGDGSRQAQDWSTLVPRVAGVVVVDDGARFFPDDGSAVVELGGGQVWPAADPALIWLGAPNRAGVEQVRLVRAATGEELARVEIPDFSRAGGDDGAGRLFVWAETGGTFTIDTAGAVGPLTDAWAAAVTPTHLLVLRCDAALVCGYEIVERATGVATPVQLGATSSTYRDLELDPSGTRVLIHEFGPVGPARRLVDLSTGTETELEALNNYYPGEGRAPATWTPDGLLVVDSRGSVAVFGHDGLEVARGSVTDADGLRMTVTAVAVGL